MSDARTPDELYQSAIASRNLGVDPDSRGDADAIMAAAWSDSEAGACLLRLQAEWEAGQKPRRPTPEQVTAIVAAMNRSIAAKPNAEIEGSETAPPKVFTAAEAIETALGWYSNELQLFFMKLRSRRPALLQLGAWADRTGHDKGMVSAVLYWWLAPTCAACGGHGYTKAPGAPRLSANVCGSCKGSTHKPIPHGKQGRALATHFDSLAQCAKASMGRKLKKNLPKVIR